MKFTHHAILQLIIFFLVGAIYFSPWQIVPSDEVVNDVYTGVLALVWIFLCCRFIVRIRKLQIKRKWLFVLVLCLLMLPTLPRLLMLLVYQGTPKVYHQYVYYMKRDNPNEKVLHVYYKFYMGGHWEFKHVKAYPRYNFRLERTFDYKDNDLDGVWLSYDINNHFKYSKTVELKDGQIIKVLEDASGFK